MEQEISLFFPRRGGGGGGLDPGGGQRHELGPCIQVLAAASSLAL